MKQLYYIFIFLYPRIAWLIRSRNAKAKQWVAGRKNIFTKLDNAFRDNEKPVIWVHCSSLGEFEQARPLMDAIRKEHTEYKLLLTFFSPSGYEVRKNFEGADWVFYLPMDGYTNARKFYAIVRPSLVLFIKYEFWYFYLNEAKKRGIPLLLISAVFREDQPFFKWYGDFHRSMLSCFTSLLVQNETSLSLLRSIGFSKNVLVSGDTRFDRVMEIANSFEPLPLIEQFIGSSKVIVAGSTWTEDDEELNHYARIHPEIKFIIAPHEIEEERLLECKALYAGSVFYSQIAQDLEEIKGNVLIVDNVGMLSKMYRYATVCFVGGGFGDDGVHNVLEAAVYSKPVVFGPVFDKYREAVELLELEAAFSIESAIEVEEIFDQLFLDGKLYKAAAAKAGDYVLSQSGATRFIMNHFYENRLLTS